MLQIFKEELEKGTGIPRLLLKKRIIKPSDEVDKILLDNVVNNHAFDPQTEGSRASYMFTLISKYKNKDELFIEIRKKFLEMTTDSSSDIQLFDFAYIMSFHGWFDKKTLFDKLKYYIENGKDEFWAIYSFAENEGPYAAESIASEFGKLLEKDPDYNFAVPGFYFNFENKDEVISYLKNSEDKYVKLYLDKFSTEPEQFKSHKKTAEEIIKKYESGNHVPLHKWLKNAEESEVKKIVDFCLSSSDLSVKKSILRNFDTIKIPVEYDILKKEFSESSDFDYKIAVLNAMLLFNNPEAKDFAYDMDIENSEVLITLIKALCIFYSEDEKYVLLEKIDSLNIYSCHNILDFLIENENLKEHFDLYKEILFKLYYKNKCSICREKIVDEFIKYNLVDKTLRKELLYDCNTDIVEKAKILKL